jgi:RNA polymerase sigma-70 factor (ECF subfamily)
MSEEKTRWENLRELDPQVLSSIHQQFHPEIFRYARYRIGDRMIAEDLASDAFIHLIDALKKGKGPIRNVRGWLFGTVNNLVNDHFRKLYQLDNRSHRELGASIIDPVSQIDADLDAHNQLSAALTTLTEEQQMVISLRFGAEMSLDETASVMGKKPNAIKALQFRAIVALRKQMEVSSDG